MIRKLVLFTGGVETLEYFSLQMGRTFQELGYAVFYYDLKISQVCAQRLRKFVKTRETAMITFNFEGLEREDGLYGREGYFWEEYQIPCFNIVVDHPMYYHRFLMQVPTRYYHISIDRTHARYLKDYYPNIRQLTFLPLAGTGLSDEPHLPITERSMDIVFTGNYTHPSECEKFINGINEEYAAFYRGIIDDFLAHPSRTFEAVMEEHCFEAMGYNPPEDLRFTYYNSIFLDLYIRNHMRGAVIRSLIDAGLVVHVFGKDWTALECSCPENLRMHPQTDSVHCLKALADAKISINVMPWFKDGAHDRIFNSMLNGAVSVTDDSIYLREELEDGTDLMFYDLLHLERLPVQVSDLLADPQRMQKMADTGRQKAALAHTWYHRAQELIRLIEEVCK